MGKRIQTNFTKNYDLFRNYLNRSRFIDASTNDSAEDTHFLHKGKYHCMADIFFDWFGFEQICKSLSNSTQAKQLNPNRSNRRPAIEWYFPLWSNWVYSGFRFKFSGFSTSNTRQGNASKFMVYVCKQIG